MRRREHHLGDILRVRERGLDSLCTNLRVTTDLAKTDKKETKTTLSASLAEARVVTTASDGRRFQYG